MVYFYLTNNHYILSADIIAKGLESGDVEKVRQTEIESKVYVARADELYEEARSKILNWRRQ